MPKFRVRTDQGDFVLELDKPPRDEDELRSLANEALQRGGRLPFAGSREISSDPTKPLMEASEIERKALRVVLPGLAVGFAGPAARAIGITSRAAMLALEAALSGAGEAGTQAVGLAEPSAEQIALATGAPFAGRAAAGAIGFLRRQTALRLPGAGESLRRAGVRTAETLPGRVAPDVSSEVLYNQLEQFNPRVNLKPLEKTVDRILKEESQATRGLGLPSTRIAKGFQEEFFQPKTTPERVSPILSAEGKPIVTQQAATVGAEGVADFQQVRLLMRRINDKIGAVKAKGGEGLGDLLQLKKALAESLEGSTDPKTGQVFELLKKANKAFRQEIAVDTLTDIISKNITPLEGREALNFSAGKALKQFNEALRKDKFLLQSFPPGSVENIRTVLDDLRRLPVIGAPPGADAGSKRALITILLGGAAGEVTGVGGTIGAVTALAASNAIASALQTQAGTRLLLRAIRTPGGLDYPKLAVLAALARSGGAALAQAESGDPAGRVEEKLELLRSFQE